MTIYIFLFYIIFLPVNQFIFFTIGGKMCISFTNRATDSRDELISELSRMKSKLFSFEKSIENFRRIANHYKTIFENGEEGVILFNEKEKILDANNKIVDFLGYTIDDLKRLHYKSITPESEHKIFQEVVPENLKESPVTKEIYIEFYHINGSKQKARVIFYNVKDANGEPNGFSCRVLN